MKCKVMWNWAQIMAHKYNEEQSKKEMRYEEDRDAAAEGGCGV